MYRAGSLRVVEEEISRNKLDLVRVQKVRWDGRGTERTGEYTFFYGKITLRRSTNLEVT
jgi:hypothetical protein